jgi:hypothetical protein
MHKRPGTNFPGLSKISGYTTFCCVAFSEYWFFDCAVFDVTRLFLSAFHFFMKEFRQFSFAKDHTGRLHQRKQAKDNHQNGGNI